MDNETLAHSTWNCKYHIVLTDLFEHRMRGSDAKDLSKNILII
jgi:REP element-mobilizing transposase RayT